MAERGCKAIPGRMSNEYFKDVYFGDAKEAKSAMSVREMPNGTFTMQFRCKGNEGHDVHKFKRGFKSRAEAEARESDYKAMRGSRRPSSRTS